MFIEKVISRFILRFIFFCLILIKVEAVSNYTKLEQIIPLQQQAIAYYNSGGSFKTFESNVYSGITVKGNLEQAIDSFKEAYEIAPERLDFIYSIASLQVLSGNLDAAENTYRSIEEKAPNDLAVLTYETAYALIWGESSEYSYYAQKLAQLKNPDVSKMQAAIKIAANSFNLKINYQLPLSSKVESGVAIVILGYALNPDGSMDKKLIERLKAGLLAAKAYPNAPLIVSGGVAQSGVTEAYTMQKWLKINGISQNRIIIEDKSFDTLTNAINTMQILQEKHLDKVILVSSANHIRRATALFQEVATVNNLSVKVIDTLAAQDKNELTRLAPNEIEKALIIRDTLRAAGLWALPGMVR